MDDFETHPIGTQDRIGQTTYFSEVLVRHLDDLDFLARELLSSYCHNFNLPEIKMGEVKWSAL